MHLVGEVHHADDAAARLKPLRQAQHAAHALRVRGRACRDDDHAARAFAPTQVVHRGVQSLVHRLGPVAAAVGLHVGQETLELGRGKAQIDPLGDVFLAFVAVGHDADARGGHQLAQQRDQAAQAVADRVDHELHAVGRVDDERHVQADLAQPAAVVAESAPAPQVAGADEAAELGIDAREDGVGALDLDGDRPNAGEDRHGRALNRRLQRAGRCRTGGPRPVGRQIFHRQNAGDVFQRRLAFPVVGQFILGQRFQLLVRQGQGLDLDEILLVHRDGDRGRGEQRQDQNVRGRGKGEPTGVLAEPAAAVDPQVLLNLAFQRGLGVRLWG